MASALLAAACFSASAITVIGIASVSAALRAAITLMILSRSAISTALGGGDLFLGRDRQRTRGLGDGLRFGLLLALGGDRDRAFLRDDLQVALHFGVAALHREIGLDLAGVAGLIGFGLLVGDRQFLLDAVFGLVLQRGLLDLRRLRAHRGGLVGDVALLRQFRLALGALDRQRGLAGDEVLLGDVDLGGADDLVALLLALPGDLGQGRQAVGVEEIARIEMLDVALVEPRQRHRFEFEAVVLDVGADRVLHRFDEGRRAAPAALRGSWWRRPSAGRRRISPRSARAVRSASLVRLPSVCAASAIDDASGLTRT